MKAPLRFTLTLVLSPLLLSAPVTAHARSFDDNLPDPQTLNQLEARAETAPPRDRCFLYAELVHTMTELAGKQMIQGDTSDASATLKKVQHYAELIRLDLAKDTKRLKNAQMLMHHTTQRLNGYLNAASGEDRPVLQATLKQLDQVQDALLTQVFAH